MEMVLEELTQDELAMLERYRKERDSDNEYTPWISEGITEADYFRRLYLEKCNELAIIDEERQWIPVSERLPENHDDILLWDYDELSVGWYSEKRKRFMSYKESGPTDYVTHWMPSPPAPDNQLHAGN